MFLCFSEDFRTILPCSTRYFLEVSPHNLLKIAFSILLKIQNLKNSIFELLFWRENGEVRPNQYIFFWDFKDVYTLFSCKAFSVEKHFLQKNSIFDAIIAKGLITNRYSASNSRASFSNIHWGLAAQYLNKKTKKAVGLFRSGYIRHPYSKKIYKKLYIHNKMRTFHIWSRNW